MAELEELIESYRAFAATVTLSAPADRATQRKLLCTNTQNHWPSDTLAETRPELARCEDLVTE
jgi:isopenicillin N synthase-like dioxygenase